MDLTPYVDWIIFLHVAGAFAFVAGHGVSMFVVFQVRKERDRAARLVRCSTFQPGRSVWRASASWCSSSSGILAGIVLGSFGKWWIWIALALLSSSPSPDDTGRHGKYLTGIRAALGQRTRGLKPADPDPVPASDADLHALLASRAPETLLSSAPAASS